MTTPWGPPPTAPPRPGRPSGPPTGVVHAAPPPMVAAPVDRRPWWGLGDVVIGAVLAVVASFVIATVVGLALADFDDGVDQIEALGSDPAVLALGLLAQQATQAAWPVIVARWKGFGVVRDFRWQFKWRDLLIGPLGAVVAIGLATVAAETVSRLLDVSDDDATNTEILTDFEGTPWFWVFVFAVAIGAPIAEELFFRGLTLRAIQKRWGLSAALFGSTIIFTVPHYSGGGWGGAAVIFTAIGVVGLVFGVLAIQTGRLGPAVIAHVVFNSFTVVVLIADDSAMGSAASLRLLAGPVLSRLGS
ncbi:MAG: lysostaphin resistance A-like protein [Acidimicrobiales bacterium]